MASPAALDLFLRPDVPSLGSLRAYGSLLLALARYQKNLNTNTGVYTRSNPAKSQAMMRIAGEPLADADRHLVVRVRDGIRIMMEALAEAIDPADGLLVGVSRFHTMFRDLEHCRNSTEGKGKMLSIVDPVRDAVGVAKAIVRNLNNITITKRMQEKARSLLVQVSSDCFETLSKMATKCGVKGYWPRQVSDFTKELKVKTTAFANKLAAYLSRPPPPPPPASRSAASTGGADADERSAKASPMRAKRIGSGATIGTDDLSSVCSTLDRFLSFSGSDVSETPETPSPAGAICAVRGSAGTFCPRVGRQKQFIPRNASVSPGAAFVARRSPTKLACPRGTSLGGTGAVVVR